MKLHGNARTCPNSRRLLIERVIEEGWSVSAAAAAAGISERTVYRWLGRWRQDGAEGLLDRSSRPLRSPKQTAGGEDRGDPLAAQAADDGR
jgi:transposase